MNDSNNPAPAARGPGHSAIVFIFVSMLLDSVGFGLIGPVMPQLLNELTSESAAVGVTYAGFLSAVYAITQFFCAPIMGGLSDRFGRRLVLLASMFALGCDYLLMALAPSLAWLFVGRFIAGIAGAAYTPAYAYVADISPPEKRAQNFGLIGAAFGAGFIVGPLVGGVLGEYGPRVPFYAAAAIGLLNFLFGLWALPESLAPTLRRRFEWRRANPVGTLIQLRKYPTIAPLLVAAALWQTAMQVLPTTWSFFAVLRFNWTPSQISYSLAFAGAIMILSQAVLTRVLLPKLGGERSGAKIGMLAGALTFFGYAAATEGWMVYVAMLIWMFAGLGWPSINTLLSKQVPPTSQGELQGGMGSLGSVAAIIGPLLMSETLGYFSSPNAPVQFIGAAFTVAGLLALCSLAVLMKFLAKDSS